MIDRYARWLLRWRYLVVLVCVAATVAMGWGIQHIGFSSDFRVYFKEDNPELNAFEYLQDVYTKNDNVVYVLQPADGVVFSRQTLSAVNWLTEQAWQTPYSSRVDSLSNFQHTWSEDDDLFVENLVADPESLSAADLARIKTVALSEPQLVHRVISDAAHVTGIHVVVQYPGKNRASEINEVATFARELAAKVEDRYPFIKVHLSGLVMTNKSFDEASRSDLTTLLPVMYAVIVVLIGILLRNVAGTVLTLLLTMFSIIGSLGFAGYIGINITAPSATAPTVILTLAIADSVHFLSSMLDEMRSRGLDKFAAITESLRLNFGPVFLTSLTTAIGFLTMNFGEVPPFADLGNLVAVGVGLAFLFSMSFLPAAMAILPVRARGGQRHFGTGAMERLAEFVIKARRNLFVGISVVILLLLAVLPRNELNDIFLHYFDETYDFRRATDFITENLSGLNDIHYSLDSGQSGGVAEPEFLQHLEAFANWYRAQPSVVHVEVITDTFKRLNKTLHGDDPDHYALPEERELGAQYLLLYEMSLPYGLDLNSRINVDKSATRMTVTLGEVSSNEILALEARAQTWLEQNGLPGMRTPGSSNAVMFARIGQRNIQAMLTAAVVALTLISLLLGFALRSWKYGLISLVPNLIPVGAAFGLWALFVGQVGLALSVVAGTTIGIVVDDTIHFMSKYLRALRQQRLSPPDAVRYAFRSVGVALLVTTLVLSAGFMVLSTSHFSINSELGLMTTITIVIALIVDFLYLPPLLLRLEKTVN
jgi:hypothetical protein